MSKVKVVVVAVALVFASGTVFAASLNPTAWAYKPGTGPGGADEYTAGLPAWIDSANLAAPALTQAIGGGGITGEVTSWVYTNPDDGHNTFVYRFEIMSGSNVTRATMGGVNWQGVDIVDAGTDADTALKSTDGPASPSWDDGSPWFLERMGDYGIGIQFMSAGIGTQLAPGDYSNLIWFETTYDSWSYGKVAVINGGDASEGLAYAPRPLETPPIPEPTGLLGMGLLVLAGRRKRRR